MSDKKTILIRDFGLFADVVKSASKIVESAKFIVTSNGLEIYGARERMARCELTTNAISSSDSLDFSIADLNTFLKILGTIREVHENDFSDFKFIVDKPFLRFESKKFKTKLSLQSEDVISKWVSKKIETPMKPVFQFKTTQDLMKRVNSHSFIFSDPSSLKIYLETKDDMEKNTLFATLGNKDTNLNNEIVLKMGLVTFGSIPQGKNVIIDIDRLNVFNALPGNEIEVSLMNLNVLVATSKLAGKNDSIFTMTVYNTLLKS